MSLSTIRTDYAKHRLLEAHAAADPFTQFRLRLESAIHLVIVESTAIPLAALKGYFGPAAFPKATSSFLPVS
jgi:pyridoxine/pyridoxamine 5'-phosphate oxidase